MTRSYISNDKQKYSYDYGNQAWIVGGKYRDCGHPEDMDCGCFGRKHKGEEAITTNDCVPMTEEYDDSYSDETEEDNFIT